jgi:hypothetical protein
MGYMKYGIDPALVERIKFKMKNPETKERVKMVLDGITKADLQDRVKVTKMVGQLAKVMNENLSGAQSNLIVDFVIAQKIDPNNMLHLLKLWGMFR